MKIKNIISIISLVLPILSYGQATRVTLSQLAQSGATDGQFVKWNNSTLTWEAATVTTGGGTVTSVGLSLPSIFAVSNSPVTGSGTLTGTLVTQTANLIFAGPSTGAAAVPTFRSLVSDDIPNLDVAKITSGTFATARGGTGLSTIGTALQVLRVNSAGTALEYATLSIPSGTVTSVGLSMPSIFTVSNSPVTSSGTLTTTLTNQNANLVFAGPSTGAAAAPTFRSLVAADIPSLPYVPTTRTLTINGTAQDLSADRSWSVGTVTSVAALTLGTTGTDVSSSVANGTTTPVITLNIPTASATNRGALSSTDWSTFNNKQSTITLTTTGNSGAATFISNTLNIPNYSLSGTQNYIPYFNTSSTLSSSGLLWNNGSQRLSLGIPNPDSKITIKNGQRASSLSTFLATQTFDASTNWTTGTNWSITGGKAQASSATSFLTYTPSLSFVGGQSYLITLSISEWTGGSIQVHVGSTTYNIIGSFSKNNYKIVVTPFSSGSVFRIYGNVLTAKLDDIKIETWSAYNLPYLSVHDSIYANYLYQSFPSLSSIYLGDKGSLVSTADFIVSIGLGALSNLNSGNFNTAIGGIALSKNVDGTGNTAIGYSALNVLSGGNYNFALGTNSMGLSYTGNYNISIGEASYYRGIGNNNIIIGSSSALTAASVYPEGSKNIILGDSSATNLTKTTSRNILIGSNLLLANSGASNQLNIGNIIFGTGVSGTGTTIAGKIGIGDSNPSARLHIKGEGNLSSSTSFLIKNSSDTTLFLVRDDRKVVIGTSDITATGPSASLTIGSLNGGALFLKTNNAINARLLADNTAFELYTGLGNGPIVFSPNASTSVYMTVEGELGVNTSDPKNTLEVNGTFGRTVPKVVSSGTTYTVDSGTTKDNWIIFTQASGTITVTLPTASSWTGREISLRKTGETVIESTVNITGYAYNTTTQILPTSLSWARLVSNGTTWVVVEWN